MTTNHEMYNLQALANVAINNLHAIDIYPNIDIMDFKVNKRYKNRYGTAKRRYNGNGNYTYSIEISAFLLDKRNDEKSVMNTIYHELLHCCDECWKDGHRGKWKEYAELVNDCYNMDICRASYFSERLNEEVLKEKKEREERASYTFHWCCEDCGNTNFCIQKRAPKWYYHINMYQCTECKSHNLTVWKE